VCDRRRVRAVAWLIVAALGAACGGSRDAERGEPVPFAPTPDPDAFYLAPQPVPDEPAGTILKTRPITFAPVLGKPRDNPAWELQFVSHDAKGHRIAAVATVVKPLAPAAGNTPLLSYQYAEDSLASRCAPSRSLMGGTANVISQAEAAFPLDALDAGWTVVYPDHEGPYGAFAVGRLAGQITLDAIRAALAFPDLGLSSTTRIGLQGYSGGAIATAWAASLQRSYAPELNIVAVVSGGTPADLVGVARNADTKPITNTLFFSLVASAVEGINRAYPELVTSILNEHGNTGFEAMKDGCVGLTGDGSPRPTGHFADFTTVPDPFDAEGARIVAPQITLPFEQDAPIADTFVYHATGDALIPVEGADAMVRAWCDAGTPLAYHRVNGSGHVDLAATGAPAAQAFMAGRLEQNVDVLPDGSTTCNR